MWQLAPFLVLALFPCALLRQQRQSRDQHHRHDERDLDPRADRSVPGPESTCSPASPRTCSASSAASLVAVIAISLVDPPIPDRRFRHHVRGFFAICGDLGRAMATFRARRPGAETRLRIGRVPARRAAAAVPHVVGSSSTTTASPTTSARRRRSLMAAMRALAFRQSALEHARIDLPAGAALRPISPSRAEELRARALGGVPHPRDGRRPRRAGRAGARGCGFGRPLPGLARGPAGGAGAPRRTRRRAGACDLGGDGPSPGLGPGHQRLSRALQRSRLADLGRRSLLRSRVHPGGRLTSYTAWIACLPGSRRS